MFAATTTGQVAAAMSDGNRATLGALLPPDTPVGFFVRFGSWRGRRIPTSGRPAFSWLGVRWGHSDVGTVRHLFHEEVWWGEVVEEHENGVARLGRQPTTLFH